MNPSVITPLTRDGGKKRDELDISTLLYKRISTDTSKLEHNLGFNKILKMFIQTLVSVLLKCVSRIAKLTFREHFIFKFIFICPLKG